ncbi:phosphoglycolate phosphatase [Clostridia bacterium]|nr:phosphoglycolate phosphatase [Clostridia bacterium]
MAKVEAVLFDLDGTLLNSLDDLADAANYALFARGHKTHETEKYKYFVGNGVRVLMERIIPKERGTEEEIEATLEIYCEYYGKHSLDKSKPYDGITDLLKSLNGMGIKCAVVTNKPIEQAAFIIEKYFGKLFDFVSGGREGVPLKPAPDMANLALSELGVSPENAFFLGDTKMDMQTAAACGAIPVGVLWGFRQRAELTENGAVHIISQPLELLNLINTRR